MFIHVDIFELSLSRFGPRECEHRILHVKLYTDNKTCVLLFSRNIEDLGPGSTGSMSRFALVQELSKMTLQVLSSSYFRKHLNTNHVIWGLWAPLGPLWAPLGPFGAPLGGHPRAPCTPWESVTPLSGGTLAQALYSRYEHEQPQHVVNDHLG